MKWSKFRGINDKQLSAALTQHAGGLNTLMQWAVVVEKERRVQHRVLYGVIAWMLITTGCVFYLMAKGVL